MNKLVEVKRDTHLVVKNDDIEKYLSKRQRKQLGKLLWRIYCGRRKEGKKFNDYYICNEDEPYANEVITAILRGEMLKD